MIIHKRTNHSRGQGFFKHVMSLVNKAIENKDEIDKVASTVKDVVNIGKNTKEIIKEIKARRDNNEISNIVDKINRLRVGKGFAYI